MADLRIEGINELLARLDNIVDEGQVMEALNKACLLVEADARKKAPKDTGELRRSITSEVKKTGSDYVGIVSTPLEYAPYIEYGTGLFAEGGGRQETPWNYKDDEGNWHSTSGLKPHPYMRPALNENRENILNLLKAGLVNNG